jgi:hypothetical protein
VQPHATLKEEHMSSRPYSRSLVSEGVRAGLMAAAIVGGLFLVADLFVGAPLLSPALLGHASATALGLSALVQSTAAAVAVYAALLVAAFVAVGIAASAVVRGARREPTILAGALLLLGVVEVSVYAVLAMVQASSGASWLPWLHVVAANVAVALSIGIVLWRTHPELGREVAVAIGGAA